MTEFDPVIARRLEDQVDQLCEEFGERVDRASIASLMSDSAERFAAKAITHEYVPPLAYRLTKERLRATNRSLYGVDDGSRDIVFVSRGGGGRAQLAAAVATMLAGERVTVHSAGTDSHGDIDASVRAVLDEMPVDMSEAFAQPVTPEVLAAADVVVTMGHSVGEFAAPVGVPLEDWRVGDPVGASVDEVRRVRDDIERRVRELLEQRGVRLLDAGPASATPA